MLPNEYGIEEHDRKPITHEITYVDILNVLLENGKSNAECRKILSKIADSNTVPEIIGLLIMQNRYSLMTEVLRDSGAEYDPRFVQLAIEHDSFDVMFKLRDLYPQSFTRDEPLFLGSVMLSFTKSNYCWLAKCFMFKAVISVISYRRAEDFLLMLAGKVEKTDPKDNPLYFTPNLLLLVLNLYEVCVLLEKEYPFLSAHTGGLTEHLTSVGSHFISEMQEEEKIRALVFEKDFENRDALELISHYDITSIMNNKNMEKIALELWSSEFDVKGNFME